MDPNGFDTTFSSKELYEGVSSSDLTDPWEFEYVFDEEVEELPSPPGQDLQSLPKDKPLSRWRTWRAARSERAKEASAEKTEEERGLNHKGPAQAGCC